MSEDKQKFPLFLTVIGERPEVEPISAEVAHLLASMGFKVEYGEARGSQPGNQVRELGLHRVNSFEERPVVSPGGELLKHIIESGTTINIQFIAVNREPRRPVELAKIQTELIPAAQGCPTCGRWTVSGETCDC